MVYDLLFRASAATLLAVAANPQRLAARIGGLMVLHIWRQQLLHHPHVHCVVPAWGLSVDGTRRVHGPPAFFLPVKVRSRVFRAELVAGLRDAFREGRLQFPGDLQTVATDAAFRTFLRSLFRQPWVVYAKPPFAGPAYVLQYLARYTHRVAIPNHRLVAVTDGTVSFRWKNYRHGSQVRTMTVSADEFLRRFLLHVLPRGFVRIRTFGLLASRCRGRDLPSCRRAVDSHPSQTLTSPTSATAPPTPWPCPFCGAAMIVIERLTPFQLYWRSLSARSFLDTS